MSPGSLPVPSLTLVGESPNERGFIVQNQSMVYRVDFDQLEDSQQLSGLFLSEFEFVPLKGRAGFAVEGVEFSGG